MAEPVDEAVRERLARRLHARRLYLTEFEKWAPYEADYELADFVLDALADIGQGP